MSEIDPYEGIVLARPVSDEVELVVTPLTFGRGRIHRRKIGALIFDDGW